jgi:hypothetical protein
MMWKTPDHSVYIGNRGDLRNPASLRDSGIEAIVDLAMEESPIVIHRDGIMLRFPLADGGGNDAATLRLCIECVCALIVTGRTVLIACSAGMSRSPAVAAHAIARARHVQPDEVLRGFIGVGPIDVSPALWGALARADSQSPARRTS